MLFLPERRRRTSSEAVACPADPLLCPPYPDFLVLPSSTYFLWSTLLLKCCLLPFFFLNFKLSEFIVCYGVYSSVFLSIFPPSHPHLGLIWEDLRYVLILTLLHVALTYLLGWGTGCVSIFKTTSWQLHQNLFLYHWAFCFCLVNFKKFQQQSCNSVGMVGCRSLQLCAPAPAVHFHCPLLDDILMDIK